ncbi:hypothetical protein NFX46_17260 [Streptomyces phaeoluteigriseus]|uniref:Uncharacterized protein n=1 Tax=Streptomyces phaeoluteigriseus TaxID=114686 RepID=A0ABY4ZAM7_9ACTN|nr:hypothetical protein [Streptomyces phaeoluteigriseus]USQ85377.1 hypothetical protein NFX46_17260 [Streptomyces phaeoluteigriseus]
MFVLLMYAAVLAIPLWGIAVVVKLISVAVPGRRPDWGRDLLRWSAGMAAIAAVMVYAIGLGSVQWDASEAESGAGSAPADPCRSLPPGTLDRLAGHEPSYFPLGFDCLLDGGRVVAAHGPYTLFNALAAAFALAAVLLLLAVGFLDEYRARAETKAGRSGDSEAGDSEARA